MIKSALTEVVAPTGGFAFVTSSMMAESEEGASQLQPLECTAAEVDHAIEDMSRKLMVGPPIACGKRGGKMTS